MEICFLTREKNVCRLIMERLENSGCRCYLQDDWSLLYKSIQDFNCQIDMIVCDFTLISGCCFNLFESIFEMGKKIPIIYYNDPSSPDDERINQWISQNELYYQFNFPKNCIPTLKKLNEIICDPSVKRHISLLQPAVPVGWEKLRGSETQREIDLLDFRFRNNLSPVLFQLFEYMYKNRTKDMSLSELEKVLFRSKKNFFDHKSSVYSYISRLKNQIETDSATKIKIFRSSRGCYRMVVY